jgi:hypothetical protein
MIAAITGNLWRALSAFLAGLVVMLAVQVYGFPLLHKGLIAQLESMTALNTSNVNSHRKTKDNFRAAMAEAQRLEVFRLARVKAEQQRINEHAQVDYDRRIAALRARYDGLRAKGRTSVASAAGGVSVPSLPVPAFGFDATTDTDGLSAALMCSTYAVQLDELITWVEAQAAVNVNEERK